MNPSTRRVLVLLSLACAALTGAFAAEPAANSPWHAHQTVPVIFPPRLSQKGVNKGEVLVRVSILETGKLQDVLVLYATEPEFAEEVMRVIKMWRFDPARINGEFFGVVGHISFKFERNEVLAVDLRAGERLPEFDKDGEPTAYHAVELRHLDRVPVPTHVEEPVYSAQWVKQGIKGTATIEFYIDETGRVRTPAVMAATHDFLGGSAAAAVADWKFDPPLRRGKPVLVRVEQTFKFSPPEAAVP